MFLPIGDAEVFLIAGKFGQGFFLGLRLVSILGLIDPGHFLLQRGSLAAQVDNEVLILIRGGL